MTTSPSRLHQGATPVTATDLFEVIPADETKAARPQVRRYNVSSLLPNGNIAETRHLAPALPLFEDAFCAFSRGSLIETEHGPVAIEDLLPGDMVLTEDGPAQPVVWKGSVTVAPGLTEVNRRNMGLTRLLADSFGEGRPMSCVLAGPSARLLYTPNHLRALAGDAQMLTPVQEFVDGNYVIETAPPTPVELFHLCLPRHAAIRVGGLAFESYHPGQHCARTMSHSMRSVFLNLFSHIRQLGDFGPLAYPLRGRGRRRQPERLNRPGGPQSEIILNLGNHL